jgi:hypothetical protein
MTAESERPLNHFEAFATLLLAATLDYDWDRAESEARAMLQPGPRGTRFGDIIAAALSSPREDGKPRMSKYGHGLCSTCGGDLVNVCDNRAVTSAFYCERECGKRFVDADQLAALTAENKRLEAELKATQVIAAQDDRRAAEAEKALAEALGRWNGSAIAKKCDALEAQLANAEKALENHRVHGSIVSYCNALEEQNASRERQCRDLHGQLDAAEQDRDRLRAELEAARTKVKKLEGMQWCTERDAELAALRARLEPKALIESGWVPRQAAEEAVRLFGYVQTRKSEPARIVDAEISRW